MNTSTHSYASVIRGIWFQLKSLAKTTFFLQNRSEERRVGKECRL